MGDSAAALFVSDPSEEADLTDIAAAAGATLKTLGADCTGTLSDVVVSQGPAFTPVPREADDLAALLYTLGTTGR